jgi:LPS export ABC transporter permease LptG/LPS export ABC transporter permease LptF
MFKTLDRYVIREILPPFFLSVLIFTFILELPPIMQNLERLVAKGVPWHTAGRILLLLAPQALGLTIPMGLLVGVLIALGRLSSDRESVALLACGVSPYRLLRPIMSLAVVSAAVTMWVLIVAIPHSNQEFREITYEIISKKVETDVQPRVFFDEFPNWVLYPRDEADAGQPGWKDLLVAEIRQGNPPKIYMAARGQLVLDRPNRRVTLILSNGTSYTTTGTGETQVYRFLDQTSMNLDPETVFPPLDLPPGVNEKTIPELRKTIEEKRLAVQKDPKLNLSPHPEIMAIHSKFSIPVACLVFALLALALGMSVARDGKFGGFVVGIGVIFSYYMIFFVSESAAKGQKIPAEIARWIPNLVMAPAGIIALMLKARRSDRVLPFGLPFRWSSVPAWFEQRRKAAASLMTSAGPVEDGGDASPAEAKHHDGPARAGRYKRRKGVVLIVRFPRIPLPRPLLIDRYVARLYLRVVGVCFLGLLGLFYISTFIDKSERIFKGDATAAMVFRLLAFKTPEFVYYVIPISALLSVLVTVGLLSRTSELTVMKACGVSLYRATASLLVLSLGFSAVLFGLEQKILARANRNAEMLDSQIRKRPPRTFSALDRRWVVGQDGAIYHYGYFDHDRAEIAGLTIYKIHPSKWVLASQTFLRRAAYSEGAWFGEDGWVQDFKVNPPVWKKIAREKLSGVEHPDYFATEQPIAEMMTVPQLRTYVKELAASGFNATPLEVELHKKIAFPFVTLVMTLLAIPFGVSTGRRGALYGIGLGIVIALTYWILISIFVALGRGGLLPPPIAGWAPNVLVVGIAAYLVLRART